MAQIADGSGIGSSGAKVTGNRIWTGLFDAAGNPITKTKNTAYAATSEFLPMGGVNDGTFRPARVDRFGGQAIAKYTPLINYQLYTAALMPGWLNPLATFTTTHATASGTLLNAAATGGANSHASLISFKAAPKYQKSPLFSRHRARLVKGGTNGQADFGLSSLQAPASAVIPNGFVFLFGTDGTLKPTVYMNSTVIAQGTDFAGSVNSANYYVWDIVLDDDAVTFICQDPNSGAIISEQTLNINVGDPRFGLNVSWFQHARAWVAGSANVGAATQVFVADSSVQALDLDAAKPWPDVLAGLSQNTLVNPTISLAQLANYANSAAPASATLSNTAAGYTTLGGQWQFAAVGGAETDYALFAFTVPTGMSLHVTDVAIDTMNTGAAAATTETWLQWFMGDAAAVTLAVNSFRMALGNQVFPIGAAIGAQATPLIRQLRTPLVVHSGRIFHLGLKMPRGTATASQVIRGTATIGGYFE